MAETVRLIQKDEIVRWIQQEGVRGYRYRPNLPGSWFLIVTGLLALGLAAFLAARSGLSRPIHTGGFAVLSAYTLWAFWIVGHWNLFAARNYIGVNDEALLVGRGSRAYLVPRSRLTRETIRMDKIRRGELTSVLPIEIGSYKTNIHLIGPFANMENVQLFIADVLEALLDGDDETEQSEQSENSGESSET